MSWFAAFGRGWCAIFAEVVHEYRRPLPSSAWHDENNCTRPISAVGSVVRPDQRDRHRQL